MDKDKEKRKAEKIEKIRADRKEKEKLRAAQDVNEELSKVGEETLPDDKEKTHHSKKARTEAKEVTDEEMLEADNTVDDNNVPAAPPGQSANPAYGPPYMKYTANTTLFDTYSKCITSLYEKGDNHIAKVIQSLRPLYFDPRPLNEHEVTKAHMDRIAACSLLKNIFEKLDRVSLALKLNSAATGASYSFISSDILEVYRQILSYHKKYISTDVFDYKSQEYLDVVHSIPKYDMLMDDPKTFYSDSKQTENINKLIETIINQVNLVPSLIFFSNVYFLPVYRLVEGFHGFNNMYGRLATVPSDVKTAAKFKSAYLCLNVLLKDICVTEKNNK